MKEKERVFFVMLKTLFIVLAAKRIHVKEDLNGNIPICK